MDLLAFVKVLKVILTERFVLMRHNWNFKRKYHDEKFKYKITFSLGCC